ncbi:hypothetical protein HWV62_35570 [Athelia sp. TMB]|nr:hypothetical protein HWV62_35570 [Athelia sp. TMB]
MSIGSRPSSQVGGHIGGLETTEDDSLIIKRALPVEVEFYQNLATSAAFEPLRPFLPHFYGTLRLEGEHDTTRSDTLVVKPLPESLKEDTDESTTTWYHIIFRLPAPPRTFLRPNILDIKLGTVLYDEFASPEKRARAEKSARETTTLETGIRITGFQVYDNSTLSPVKTDKLYGKSLKAAELPAGIARCLPVASTSNIALGAKEPSFGLPCGTLLPIMESLREDIADLCKILEVLELRMVGASLLIIHESDWDRAAQGVKLYMEEGSDDINSDESEDEEDESEDEAAGTPKRPGPPYTVNLIDFAHTRLAPGKGPDRGVLLGLSTLMKLFDDRIKELRAMDRCG